MPRYALLAVHRVVDLGRRVKATQQVIDDVGYWPLIIGCVTPAEFKRPKTKTQGLLLSSIFGPAKYVIHPERIIGNHEKFIFNDIVSFVF